MKTKYLSLFIFGLSVTLSSCYNHEDVKDPVITKPFSDDPIDQYIQTNFTDTYGVAVRYKYVDRYIDPSKKVTPPKREVVEPMLDFLTNYWINPFINVSNGKTFFEKRVPPEIILIGSSIFNGDGTVTLGTADAGARITLTEVNDIDINNPDWILRQLGTIYHEFAHIVHQNYGLPINFEKISSQGYTSSASWYNLTNDEALMRGFVSPYATSSKFEDFAETVAFLLFDKTFYADYINQEQNCTTSDCDARNEGRKKIKIKYDAILALYKQYTSVDLLEVRALVQEKL